MRAVVEAVLEPILFDPKPWTTYLVTEEAVRGGEVRVLDYGDLPAAPFRSRVIRSLRLRTEHSHLSSSIVAHWATLRLYSMLVGADTSLNHSAAKR